MGKVDTVVVLVTVVKTKAKTISAKLFELNLKVQLYDPVIKKKII